MIAIRLIEYTSYVPDFKEKVDRLVLYSDAQLSTLQAVIANAFASHGLYIII